MSKIKLPKKIAKIFNTIIIIISLAFVFFVTNNYPVRSQSITGLNSDISSLRTRINRLESEVRRLQTTNNTLPANNLPRESVSNQLNSPAEVDGQIIGQSSPFSERLATLLIELREDVNNIENRLTVLEQQ